MKSTKFTIGATAFVLAFIGALATKGSNRVKFTNGFTLNGTPSASVTSCLITGYGMQLCQDVNGYTLYTTRTKALNVIIATIRTLGQ
jgi:hypothetical protein